MKKKIIGVVLVLVMVITIIGIVPGIVSAASIIYVDTNATGANDGSSWSDAYTDLQDALTGASSGDEIWVAMGTYKPTTTTDRAISFQMIENVALYGGFNATETAREQRNWETNVTTLSGDIGIPDDTSDNSYHVVLGDNAILDGFTITGGNATGINSEGQGGGMYNNNSSPTVTSCIFSDNSAVNGAGMFNEESSPTVTNCSFSENSGISGVGMYNNNSSPTVTSCTFLNNNAVTQGGGMVNSNNSSPTVTGCTFHNNQSQTSGGAIENSNSSPTVTNCTFSDNFARYGGGIINLGNSSPTVTNCTFSDNGASRIGGGMFNEESSPTVTNCTFLGNSSTFGGGMTNYDYSSPVVTNCIFMNNSTFAYAGGMCNWENSSPTVTNCTFSGNSHDYEDCSGGICPPWVSGWENSSPTVTNCIFWDNNGELFNIGVNEPIITYSDIQGGYSGAGNIDADPLFENAATGDFHLQFGSPCIETGNNSAPSLPSTDFEGDPRILDGDNDTVAVVDMGVDEYIWVNFPPVADAGTDQNIEANTIGGAYVTLDGSGSYDLNGDPLTYTWSWDSNSTSGVGPTIFLPLGTTTITLIVNDGGLDSDPDTVDITVEDTTPPEVTVELIPIKIKAGKGTCTPVYSVNDICDPNPTVTAVVELPFVNGMDYEYKYKNGVIGVKGPYIMLKVTAVDASGNVGMDIAMLEFTD